MMTIDQYKANNAAREARKGAAEKKIRETLREAEISKKWFFNHPDRIVKYTGWLQLYTSVLATATILMFAGTITTALILSRADETTRESFTAVQRAFVFANELKVSHGILLPIYWGFGVMTENSGNTPTKEMEYLTISDLALPNDPEDIFLKTPKEVYGHEPTLNQRRSGDLLGPKAQMILVGSQTGLPDNVVAKMTTDRTNYYVRGVIHYHDVFRGTEEHVTKFCFAAIPYNDGKEFKIGVERCLYWNCADADCKADRERYDRDLRALNALQKSGNAR
jgi:hypothetical protein